MTHANKYIQKRVDSGLCPHCGRKVDRPGKQTCKSCSERAAKSHQRRKTERRAEGKCVCGRIPEQGKKYCAFCLDGAKRYAQSHKADVKRRQEGYEQSGKAAKWRGTQLERYWNRVFEYYGKVCACCGESERMFLTIDHIANDGAKHRSQLAKGTPMAPWIVRHGFPPGFQILCRNCNWGKHVNHGVCPHKT